MKRDLIGLHTSVLLLSGASLSAKLITLAATQTIALRALIATLALFVFVKFTGTRMGLRSRADLGWILLTGLIVAAHWVVFFTGIQASSVAIVLTAFYTFPVITVLMEALLHRHAVDRRNLVLALIVFAGVYLAVPGGFAGGRLAIGAALGILSGCLYSLRNVLYRKHLRNYPASAMMLYQTAVVAVVLLPFLSTGIDLRTDHRWIYLLALGVLFTAVAHTLYVNSLRTIRASTAGLISCMEPIYGMILAAVVLGEKPGMQTIAGALIVVTAAVYTSIRVNRTAKEEASKVS
ncbi:MAG: DMT family transporter [Deltaproteobacteria bacterium]|nr:DMT family transporter [Deltaproteobacteria bacterium]